MATIGPNKVVEIEYSLLLEDRKIVESTEGKPLPYLHGSDDMLDALQAALVDKTVGDRIAVTLTPAEAFGEYDEELIDEVDRSEIPDDVELEVGQQIMAVADDGTELPAVVGSITDEAVFIDLNHPLAGEVLNYEIEIVSIRDATPQEIENNGVAIDDDGCDCDDGHHH